MNHIIQARIRNNQHKNPRYPYIGKVLSDKKLQDIGPLFCPQHPLITDLTSTIDCLVKVVSIEKKAIIGEVFVLLAKVPPALSLVCKPLLYRQINEATRHLNMNLLLVGPHGSGKTTTAKLLAQNWGMEFVYSPCAGILEPSDFFAKMELAIENGHTVTRYQSTPLRDALITSSQHQRPIMVMLDEINRSSEAAQNALFPLLDKTRLFHDPITEKFIHVPDNVKFIAAANLGNYSGVFRLDPACLDRFLVLELPYPSAEDEINYLCDYYQHLPKTFIRKLVSFADHMRNDPLLPSLSLRITRQLCEQMNRFLDLFNGDSDGQNWHPDLLLIIEQTVCGRLFGGAHQQHSEAALVKERILHFFSAIKPVRDGDD